MAEFRKLDLAGDYFDGQNMRLAQERARQGNALGANQVRQSNALAALSQDPNATPEQYARAGDTATANSLNQSAQLTAEQKQRHAKQIVTAAQYALQSPDPKAFIEQNFPELAQSAGASWQASTPEQAKAKLNEAIGIFGPLAGIAPTQEKFGGGQMANYNGQPAMVQVGDAGTVRPVAGVTPYSKPAEPGAGDNYDPQSVENTAQMIANNQIPMLSGFALRSKWGQEVISRVRELNPQFAGADYGSNLAGIKQFTSGKNGNTVRSLNVAVQHLDQLGQLATALNNSDTPAVNRLSLWWKKNTGEAPPANFDAAKKIVADELVKAIVGSGGGVADREEAANSINAAGSPEQLAKVIETYQGLMTGQLNGLRQQYKASTGRDNFEDMLLPETRVRLEKHGEGASPYQDTSKRISPEEAAKLPAGTRFTGMDGVPRVKH